MTAVWIRVRAELRARSRAWLAVALLAGVAGGVVVAAVAAAQRTETAYGRYLQASNRADAYVDPGFAFGGDESLDLDRIGRLPEVAAAEYTALLAVISQSRTGRNVYPSGPGAVQYVVPTDGRVTDRIDRPKLLRGRLPDPDRAAEALADTKAAAALGVDVGDPVTLRVASHDTLWKRTDTFHLTADPRTAGGGPLATVRIVGVAANAKSSVDSGVVHLTRGFYRAYGGAALGAWLTEMKTRLERRGADLRRFEADVQRIAGKRPYGFFEPDEGRLQVQRSITLLARALRILAVAGAMAALLLVGQLLFRQAALDAAGVPTLRAIGMSQRQLLALGAVRSAAIAIPASAVTVLVAIGVSPLTPFGWARELEPDPGFAFAAGTIAAGAAIVLATVLLFGLAGSAAATHRPGRKRSGSAGAASVLAGAALPPAAGAGLRMALVRRGAGSGVPVGATLIAAVAAVGVAATALTFAGSLQHLIHTPHLYGRTWDFEIAGGGPPLEPRFVRELVHTPGVTAVATGVVGPVQVNGRTTGANATDDIKGAVPPTILEGRPADGPGEIVLGAKLAKDLHVRLGERVTVKASGGSGALRVVGLGVMPATKWNKLGAGAAFRFATLERIQPGVKANAAEIRVAAGAEGARAVARLRTIADGPSSAVTPDEVANFGGVTKLPFFIAVVFALAAAATLAHALITSIRRRRPDVAVLKTLGFTRTQVMETIAWQATTVAAIGLLVGLPLGLALGRFAWNVFAQDLGVVPEPTTPIGTTALIVPASLLLANLIAALPARTAAATQPATALRAE